MKKRVVFLIILVLVIAGVAYAATDFTCLNDCTRKGYMYNYCMDRCSYNDSPRQHQPQTNPYQVTPIPQTDFKCLNDCTRRGYMYNYCKEQCSY